MPLAVRYKSVLAASGNVPHAVFLKAAKSLGVPKESYRIGDEVFVKGFRQASVARHVGVSRQRVHTVCTELLEAINQLMPKMEQRK